MKHLAAHFPLLYLDPKQCHVARTPTLVSTILGSCVAITIFDPVSQIGGVAHAFLPTRADYPDDTEAPCKFVDDALEHLLEIMGKGGAVLDCLETKLFGGAEIMNRDTALHGRPALQVGARNVEMARRLLRQRGLTPAAQDVGGNQGRKLMFLSHTGGAWVKKI
ncbi:chemotaxis protein CheD [Megalodesulfovibrio gigas]|uniref:Probable chemoreceptor glutamine deamidase CheD n=1 Tax=Megalodesulfovibrio gigas (strain ATCC 19364 / DSM 1382 / NCIMB 9332 / VKM B-1759) TaxID=1121448 RepID=T2GCU3_MEGG1|nr:chemotaxis protein CheD [Megalodesulfovibrio gigas]AGW13727.1 putative CheD family protein [Megalodesulfovibrio gigas DSM 1382 = ATCC 19364]